MLTPIAATGLLTIMIGAVTVTAMGSVGSAVVPAVVGVALTSVAYGRARALAA